MGREIRRVPADWEHPKDFAGKHIPMHERFPYSGDDIDEGLREGWLEHDPPNYGVAVMPGWPQSERTHYQVYEACTEGTPLSPVFATPQQVNRWCADNGELSFEDMMASQEHKGDRLLAACEEAENWIENTQDLEGDGGAIMLLGKLRKAISKFRGES